jgi:1-phosphofructokinase
MLTVLGDTPVLCTPIGGETGVALRALLGDLPTDGLLSCSLPNGSYVHDRRSGEREVVAQFPSGALDRHMEDDLVSLTLACGLGSAVVVVCGSNLDGNIDASVFQRVCANLQSSGTIVIADLAGAELRSALAGGITLLKVSDAEMVDDGWAASDSTDDLLTGIESLRKSGASDVVVSCGERGALAAIGSEWLKVDTPSMNVVDHRGAGDSMTAALAYSTSHGLGALEAVRLASAAAALNVSRHGLASGHAEAIWRLQPLVEVTPIAP